MKKSLLLAALVVAVTSVVMNPLGAIATHQPADKAAATASDLDEINRGNRDLLLQERMRVSSTSDLILQTSAECSILTSLFTEGGPDVESETDGAFGQVKLWLEIDGKRVPVSTDDTATDPSGDDDLGEVVFCNRAYARTVTDREQDEDSGGDGDGIDSEDDFIRTRTANAFNWMAFDVGKAYDTPANGNNIVEVKLFAQHDVEPAQCPSEPADNVLTPYGETCADAFVGSRSLIIEAVHAANHEQAAPAND